MFLYYMCYGILFRDRSFIWGGGNFWKIFANKLIFLSLIQKFIHNATRCNETRNEIKSVECRMLQIKYSRAKTRANADRLYFVCAFPLGEDLGLLLIYLHNPICILLAPMARKSFLHFPAAKFAIMLRFASDNKIFITNANPYADDCRQNRIYRAKFRNAGEENRAFVWLI